MKTLTALITGFAPFGGHALNPSWLAVESLPDSLSSLRLVKLQLPVSFSAAFSMLEKMIDEVSPDLVICVGLAEKRSTISVERVAINVADARIPDNDGNQPVDRLIDYSAANAYFSNMPLRKIVAALDAIQIPVSISDSAGSYVCNQVMFKLLHLIACRRPNMMGGFIHVPCLPEMLGADSVISGMPLEQIATGLKTVLQTSAEHILSGQWHGTRREIVPYQANWPEEFALIASTLRSGLGEVALRIDHIGSTAVPGLAAKDVIDVQITVAALDERVFQAMQALGYTRAENIVSDHAPAGMSSDPAEWQKWFFRAPSGQRPTNTHVRIAGRANQRYPLLFRDYLRAHPQTAAAYGQLKMRLADNLANARMYPDVKDPAVDLIYFPAEKWAAETGWKL